MDRGYLVFFVQRRSSKDDQRNARVGASQIPRQKGVLPGQLPAMPGPPVSLLTRQKIVDLPFGPQVDKQATDLLPDRPALAAGAVAVNEQQGTVPLGTALGKLLAQPDQGLFHRGQPLFQIDGPHRPLGARLEARHTCRPTERTAGYSRRKIVAALRTQGR